MNKREWTDRAYTAQQQLADAISEKYPDNYLLLDLVGYLDSFYPEMTNSGIARMVGYMQGMTYRVTGKHPVMLGTNEDGGEE